MKSNTMLWTKRGCVTTITVDCRYKGHCPAAQNGGRQAPLGGDLLLPIQSNRVRGMLQRRQVKGPLTRLPDDYRP